MVLFGHKSIDAPTSMSSPERDHARPNSPAETAHDSLRTRRRAPVACQACSRRKVRCNVSISGRPCANCQHDRADCEVLPRKKHGPRKKKLHTNGEAQRDRDEGSSKRNDPLIARAGPPQETGSSYCYVETHTAPNLPTLGQNINERHLPGTDLDEAADSANFAIALDAPTVPLPGGNTILGYIGDRQGTGTFIHNLCNGPAENGTHYLVPRTITNKAQQPEDLAYLRIKGCFSLPTQEVAENLVQCYFHHVQPFLPILNSRSFLEEFATARYQNLSLLLLWSIFFAASSFVEPEIVQKAGYISRKAMKRAMYQRAKCLYDMDYEEDKISLIQSVILMAFWYSDTEDRTGAWHWIGIAISLSHSIGLHRNPESAKPERRLPKAQISILKRIWWSCVVRDRWLSLALGRPMRINPNDCEMPMPVAEDVVDELKTISRHVRDKYVPQNPEWLAGLWVRFLKISDLLGNIIRVFYRQETVKPNGSDMERYENELLKCAANVDFSRISDRISLLHSYQVQLFYEAAVIVLHRPYVRLHDRGTDYKEENLWQADSHRKAKAAAASLNSVLERIIESDMVKLLKPMTITTLIPAMQMHLLEMTSTTTLSRRLGNHKFQLCMMVLSELRTTYWGADAIYRFLDRAQSRLEESQTRDSPMSSAADISILTPSSTTHTKERHQDSRTSLDSLLSSENFMFDSSNPFTIISDINIGQNMVFGNIDWRDDDDLLNTTYDINSFLSFDQFNTQCLDMPQSQTGS